MAYKTQMLGNYPEESVQYSELGESLKLKELELVFKTLCSVQNATQWPKSENQETLE
jgi:hypothetical protein